MHDVVEKMPELYVCLLEFGLGPLVEEPCEVNEAWVPFGGLAKGLRYGWEWAVVGGHSGGGGAQGLDQLGHHSNRHLCHPFYSKGQ
ncbi:hypothetical protein HAX54_031079 [Datura stramonium]|uniref:Uncharacterized protein n=1 Tax=Datura stramonium TaxID=4076 RepID=A0ABS8SBM3_DATST|nr:hypothetical protein [Datura stramonium]